MPKYEPNFFRDDSTDIFFRVAIIGYIIVGVIAILGIIFS